MTLVTLAGKLAEKTINQFDDWVKAGEAVDRTKVDLLCLNLRKQSTSLPFLYYTEWIDRWLMGNDLTGPNCVAGNLFQITLHSRITAKDLSKRVGDQHQEQRWLAARLQEASEAWADLEDSAVVILSREVFDCAHSDEEIMESLKEVPSWFSE